ncbi:TRAM domain-containing protein [Candidatus Woesearchaeota archaeon]|nr:TRAM domain-containing protein [Candidatus Woesearchaeota archaeon]
MERTRFAGETRRSDSGSQRRRSVPVVKVGEEYDVVIESVGHKGDGLAKIDNFAIFVKETHKGDELKIRITKVLEKVAFAEKV